MYKEKGVTREHVFYKQPYSIVGGGAGVWHQAYGQLIYNDYEIPANLSPASFEPPSGYKRIKNSGEPDRTDSRQEQLLGLPPDGKRSDDILRTADAEGVALMREVFGSGSPQRH